jgi:hypothetical protein
MNKFAMALAATSMLAAAPALADHNNKGGYGGKVGQDTKVCLITYDRATTMGLPAENVVKAQYLPLRIALSKDTSASLIVTYGSGGPTGGGIDIANVSYNDSTVDGINIGSTTEEACMALEDYVEMRDDND